MKLTSRGLVVMKLTRRGLVVMKLTRRGLVGMKLTLRGLVKDGCYDRKLFAPRVLSVADISLQSEGCK